MKKNIFRKIRILLILTMALITFGNTNARQNPKDQKSKPDIIIAINGYSFSDLLSAKDERNHEQVYTLFNLLDWLACQNIKALDPTGYFFPTYPEVPSDEYIQKFKNRAAELGITLTGTGIRNNFASPDSAVRAAGVELAKKWIVVASKLGVPVLRLFAGEIPAGYENKWDEVAGWMVECYKECAVYAEKYGVKIGIQNHGDMLQTADQCIKVLKAVNSKWAGLIVDTGNFRTDDPYKDIEEVAPYAVNWQIKESPRGIGAAEKTDYVRLIKILKKQGYKGYVPVETLAVKGINYDPFTLVTDMFKELNAAIAEVY
jgi:sugar phosphate isomerase/epimerase